ncbi:MAG: Dyp-type peroxidase [Thermoplasmata archaeon]|nr:Dyp-type peroxidase [Thermoplasmata archaeon]
MGLLLPQFGIFAQGTGAHYFLELDVRWDVTPAELLDSFRRLRAPEVSAGGINLVIAFGSDLWRSLPGSRFPESLANFREIMGVDGPSAPATQHDVWLWISGSSPDVAWEHARAATELVRDVANVASEQAGFSYRGSRDITGFIDGTANPPTLEAADVALVPPGEPGEGGSFVLVQRWVHDLRAFSQLPVEEQERVIGRTKGESVELSDDLKPPSAHIARVTIEVEGAELEIVRRSVPFGSVEEHGLYFVGFSADPSRFARMLSRMFGTSGDGIRDRLTDFSRPVSGAFYFAPSQNALRELAGSE